MRKDFDSILDECLERVMKGEADVEACLARYPEYAEELKELLETALVFQQVESPEPSHQAVDMGQERLIKALEEKRGQRANSRGFPGWFMRPRHVRWAGALAALVVLLVTGTTVALASGSSLPGQPLYPVKRGIEEMRLALTFQTPERPIST